MERKLAQNLAITFVLPAINETDSLRTTVETIVRLAAADLHEMLIITADRTTPETRQTAGELKRRHGDLVRIHDQQLPRLGGAMRDAFELATGSHVMLMATDLETDPELIPRFIEKMREGRWDIVSGSRWLAGGGFEGYGRVRKLLNRLFQRSFRLLYGGRLTDLTFAYRLYRREVLQGIRWQDYINYEAPLGTKLSDLPAMFGKGELKELSKIELTNIESLVR